MYYIERVLQSWKAATSTTSICMPEGLKARVAAAAKHSGTIPCASILHAIAEKAEQMDLRADFDAATGDRYARIVVPERRFRGPKCAAIWKMDRLASATATGQAAHKPAP